MLEERGTASYHSWVFLKRCVCGFFFLSFLRSLSCPVLSMPLNCAFLVGGRRRDRFEFESRWWRSVLDTTICDEVCQWLATGRWCVNHLNQHNIFKKTWWTHDYKFRHKVSQFAAGRWFSPGTPVSSADKADIHDITEIMLKVALNTINQAIHSLLFFWFSLTFI